MLTEPVLIDTGPLVAYFNKRDAYNAQCANVLNEIAPPLYTCWPVLTEAAYLLLYARRPASCRKDCSTRVEPASLEILPLGAHGCPYDGSIS